MSGDENLACLFVCLFIVKRGLYYPVIHGVKEVNCKNPVINPTNPPISECHVLGSKGLSFVAQFSSEGNFLRCKPPLRGSYRFSHPPKSPLVSGVLPGILRACTKTTKNCRVGRLLEVGENFILSLSPKQLGVVSFSCLGWELWVDDIGGQLTRSRLQGWELKRYGDTYDLGDFLRNLCLLEENITTHLLETHGIPWVLVYFTPTFGFVNFSHSCYGKHTSSSMGSVSWDPCILVQYSSGWRKEWSHFAKRWYPPWN